MSFKKTRPRSSESPCQHISKTIEEERARHLRFLRTLRTILRAATLPVGNTRRIQHPAHDMVTHTRKILHSSAANHHDGMFLQIVSDAGNVRRHFHAIGKTNACDFPKRGVRLLRCRCRNLETYATLVGTRRSSRVVLERIHHEPERGRLGFLGRRDPRTADQLIQCRHRSKT